MQSGSLYEGCPIQLEHHPDNPYDSNAIAVKLAASGAMLGHLSRLVAQDYATAINAGVNFQATIVKVAYCGEYLEIDIRIHWEQRPPRANLPVAHDGVPALHHKQAIRIQKRAVKTEHDERNENQLSLVVESISELAGVYAIENTKTHGCYIGSSQNIRSRLRRHLSELRAGHHVNSRLQGDYSTRSDKYFIAYVIEDGLELGELAAAEKAAITNLRHGLRLYNLTDDGQGVPPRGDASVWTEPRPIVHRNTDAIQSRQELPRGTPRPGSNEINIPQQNLYDVIELPQDASQARIEEQCIRLGERYRPDRNSSESRAAFMFAQVEKAYETLSDPVKRAAYDVELLRQSSLFKGAKLNKLIWLLLFVVTVVIQATHSDFQFALGYSIPWFVVGMVLSPIWWSITKKGRIAPWRWFDWLNAGAYITVCLLILSVFVNSWVRTQVAGGLAVERLQREETARIAAVNSSRVADETRRAAEERARIAEYQALVEQARVAEERAGIAEEQALAQQARAAEAQAAGYNQARARADAQQLARIESLRQQCEGARSASSNTNRGSLASFYGASTSMKVCGAYEQALKRR